jgi:hypothetical protein
MQGCRGHNCDADDWEIHEVIPDVMVVLHGNPLLKMAFRKIDFRKIGLSKIDC